MDKDISLPDDFSVIGHPPEIKELLTSDHHCFGKLYDAKHEECISCRAPCVANNKVVPLNHLCRRVCQNRTVAPIRKLSSSDIEKLLNQDRSVFEIFEMIAGEDPTKEVAREARKLMYNRFYYLSSQKEYPTPDLPPLEDFIS